MGMSKTVGLVAVGSYVPERILTNADLEKMVDTSDEWIVTRTGVKERRIAGPDVHASDLGTGAARNCLAGSDLVPDLLVASTGTAETRFPYQASVIANRLQLSGLPCFDINAACSGLVYSLVVGYSLMQTGPYQNALITAGEKMSLYMDYSDRTTCVLFGDGGSALLLSAERPQHPVAAYEMGSDAAGCDQIIMGGVGDDYYFRQEGKNVFKFAVNKVVDVIDSLKTKIGYRDGRRLYVIPHQANTRIIQASAEKSGLPESCFITNLHKYGNTSSASIGLALEDAWRAGRFQTGDLLFLIGFGAGLSWAGMAIEW
jgi:3-oxoacyl-[acyl-carrier-protein] synthase-3